MKLAFHPFHTESCPSLVLSTTRISTTERCFACLRCFIASSILNYCRMQHESFLDVVRGKGVTYASETMK